VQAAFAHAHTDDEVRLIEINPDSTVPVAAAVGMHLLDTVIHTWDVAISLGNPYRPDHEILDIVAAGAKRVPAGASRTRPGALVTVDHTVLEQLVEAATTDATADEVTPALTAGPAWTPTRIAWLRDFHGDRRAGLDGPAREATWAITVDQRVVGSLSAPSAHGAARHAGDRSVADPQRPGAWRRSGGHGSGAA